MTSGLEVSRLDGEVDGKTNEACKECAGCKERREGKSAKERVGDGRKYGLLDRRGGRREGTNKLTHARKTKVCLGRKRGEEHIICELHYIRYD